MDEILDQFSEFLTWIALDLDGTDQASDGREGLTCEVVLRAGILKQRSSLSYRQLEHQLADSRAAQNFTRVDPHAPPKRAALHKCISAVTAHTWERINKRILKYALDQKIELGHKVRIDSTVTESNILAPVDSRLLFDGIRVLTALLEDAGEALGRDVIKYRSHLRAAKRRVVEISGARGEKRKALYRKLLTLTRNTIGHADGALVAVAGLDEDLKRDEDWLAGWEEAVKGSCGLVGKIVDQTQRRVFEGETVPASEKVVSMFEPHTDIIVKGRREVQFGHKVNLGSGASGGTGQ